MLRLLCVAFVLVCKSYYCQKLTLWSSVYRSRYFTGRISFSVNTFSLYPTNTVNAVSFPTIYLIKRFAKKEMRCTFLNKRVNIL